MKSMNPATGQEIREYPEMTADEVSATLEKVHETFLEWRTTAFTDRRRLMQKAAELLLDRKEELADLATQEMGKVRKEGIAEVEKCSWVCRFYASEAENFLKDEAVETDQVRSFVSYRPIGIVLAVMPWNFPYWQVFRFAAPTLMGGNAAVLKHASNVPGCALAIEAIFRDAGFPEDLFRTLMIGSSKVESVIADRRVRAVTLTGSTAAGRAVASTAGHHLKKTVLELGGSDAYLILADADLELAADLCAQSRLLNSGQSCIAAKRFLVVDEVHDAFVEHFLKAMKSKVMGESHRRGHRHRSSGQFGPARRTSRAGDRIGQGRSQVPFGGRDSVRPGSLLSRHHPGRREARDARLQRGTVRPRGFGDSGEGCRRGCSSGQRF